jgi:hypothetical protein
MNEARQRWLLAYNQAHRTGRQWRGPLTARTLEVLDVLSGIDGPVSYTGIANLVADRYGSCARSTVAEAIKTLRDAGLLAWTQRHGRIWRQREVTPRWRAVRLENVYRIRVPGSATAEA